MSEDAQSETYDRVTVSMPSSTLRGLRAAVQAGAAPTVPALVSEAVAARLARDQGLRALAALRGDRGPLPEEAMAWARRALGVDEPVSDPAQVAS